MFDTTLLNTVKEKTAAFTGHRTIKMPAQPVLFGDVPAITPDEYIQVLRTRLDTALDSLISDGYDTFLCGMAAGFDLMAGEVVARRVSKGIAVRLIALIPHPGQAYNFSRHDKSIYDNLLSVAAGSHIVCQEYSNDCFHRRNDLLVDNSSALICYYDGSPGGTRYTVKRALKQDLKIINLL